MTENEVVAPNEEEVEQKTGVSVWVWVLGVLLLLAIVAGAFLFFNRTPAVEDDSWAKVQLPEDQKWGRQLGGLPG